MTCNFTNTSGLGVLLNNKFKLFNNKKGNEKKKKREEFQERLGFLSAEEVNRFIITTVNWYNHRFSDDYLDDDERGNVFIKVVDNVANNSENMTFSELNNRLSEVTKNSLKCRYIGDVRTPNFVDTSRENINIPYICIKITKLNTLMELLLKKKQADECVVIANPNNGQIIDIQNSGENFLPKAVLDNYDKLSLDNLLFILKRYSAEDIDLDNLEECVKRRNNDIKIRDKIVDFISKRLIEEDSVDKDNHKYGNMRANAFVCDFKSAYNQASHFGISNDEAVKLMTDKNIKKDKTRILKKTINEDSEVS